MDRKLVFFEGDAIHRWLSLLQAGTEQEIQNQLPILPKRMRSQKKVKPPLGTRGGLTNGN